MFGNLGFEGWVFGLTGLAAIVFGVISFLGFIPLPIGQSLQIVIGAIGAIMLAVVAQASRRQAEFQELKDLVGIADVKLLDNEGEFPADLVSECMRTKGFVNDVFVNWATPRREAVRYLTGKYSEYNRELFRRVTKDEISFRQVQVIYHAQGFQELIHRLLLHEGHGYYIRYYDKPPVSIPILHVTSFDDRVFYLGVGYPKGQPAKNQVLRLSEPNSNQLLKNYWQVLWDSATPLNTGRLIDWDEIRKLGTSIGLTESEIEDMLSKVRKDVERDGRNLRR